MSLSIAKDFRFFSLLRFALPTMITVSYTHLAFLMPQAEALSQVHSGKKALAASLLVLFISLAGIGALFSLTFRWDNKYTYTGNTLHVLAEGWEFYPDLSLDENWNDNDAVFNLSLIHIYRLFGCCPIPMVLPLF